MAKIIDLRNKVKEDLLPIKQPEKYCKLNELKLIRRKKS